VVAARLSEDPRRQVLLVEAGPGGRAGGGLDPFAAVDDPDRVWPDLMVDRSPEQGPALYLQGRGLGGSSAVNGMVASWGPPADYDRWGVPAWSAAALTTAVARVEATLAPRVATERGPVNRAIGEAAARAGRPVEPVRATTAGADRVSVADAYLAPVGRRRNLTVRTGTTVDALLLHGRVTAGVRLDTGEELEGAEVVVCTGAIHSPALLLRSGVERPGLGEHLQDHPALRIVLPLAPDRQARERCFPFAITIGDGAVQLLPMDHTGDLATGAVLVSLMASHGRGCVSLDGDRPAVQFNLLVDERDRDALANGLLAAAQLAADAGFAPDVPALDQLGDVFHAAGTCRMGAGAVVDERLRVIGYDGLRVADASIMPVLPRAQPMLTCALIGERLAELW
jgi:choline dehydrogenase/5-(hydroxymethyl)furfural/furfural oxidase